MSETKKPNTVIADHPPADGREWSCQCARCGSSCDWSECDWCGGEGVDGHDCGEDCCCCSYPDDNVTCDICCGTGGWWTCLSSASFCLQNPLPGREDIKRGNAEWFVVYDRTEANDVRP